MRLLSTLAFAMCVAACDQVPNDTAAKPQAASASTQNTPIGPSGVTIGMDIRRVAPIAFAQSADGSADFATLADYCPDVATISDCDAAVTAHYNQPARAPRSIDGKIDMGGRRANFIVYFNEHFVVDTVIVHLGRLNQNAYEAMLLTLHERYGVNEASQRDYDAYNSSTSACLTNANDSGTVYLVSKKGVSYSGEFDEASDVIYRSRDANNETTAWLARYCLPLDASGL